MSNENYGFFDDGNDYDSDATTLTASPLPDDFEFTSTQELPDETARPMRRANAFYNNFPVGLRSNSMFKPGLTRADTMPSGQINTPGILQKAGKSF